MKEKMIQDRRVPELNKIYSIAEVAEKWSQLFGYPRSSFYLPTELVISEPKVVTPDVGYYYDTPWKVYHGTGEVMNWTECQQLCNRDYGADANSAPYANSPNVMMIELFQDLGSDGHIDYRLRGYAFVTSVPCHPYHFLEELWTNEDI